MPEEFVIHTPVGMTQPTAHYNKVFREKICTCITNCSKNDGTMISVKIKLQRVSQQAGEKEYLSIPFSHCASYPEICYDKP